MFNPWDSAPALGTGAAAGEGSLDQNAFSVRLMMSFCSSGVISTK